MTIKQFPFNPNTAQNGDVLVHRSWGSVVYIGKHPTQQNRYVVWDTVEPCFLTVSVDSMTKEVECEEKWVNLTVDLYNGGLLPSRLYSTKAEAEEAGKHTVEFVCTTSIIVPKTY